MSCQTNQPNPQPNPQNPHQVYVLKARNEKHRYAVFAYLKALGYLGVYTQFTYEQAPFIGVGQTGGIYFYSGRHEFAKDLDLNTIPELTTFSVDETQITILNDIVYFGTTPIKKSLVKTVAELL